MIRVIIEREVAEGLEEFYESAIANLLGVLANARSDRLATSSGALAITQLADGRRR